MHSPAPRSALYLPASNGRAIEKARGLACDAVILDLEDSVAPEAKDSARAAAAAALADGFPGKFTVLRVNSAGTPWCAADFEAARSAGPDAVLIPKVETVEDVDAAAALAGPVPLWLMMETSRAILNAGALAAHPRVTGMVAGWNDLALGCGLTLSPDRRELWHAMSALVLAARAHGRVLLDGVPLTLRDAAAARAEAAQARAFGFDGKTVVHPDQIGPVQEGFTPSPAERDAAQALIAVWEARAPGVGVIQHGGRMVEALHVEAARRLLALARESA